MQVPQVSTPLTYSLLLTVILQTNLFQLLGYPTPILNYCLYRNVSLFIIELVSRTGKLHINHCDNTIKVWLHRQHILWSVPPPQNPFQKYYVFLEVASIPWLHVCEKWGWSEDQNRMQVDLDLQSWCRQQLENGTLINKSRIFLNKLKNDYQRLFYYKCRLRWCQH